MSTKRSLNERIEEKLNKEQEYLQKAKQYSAQAKKLEQQKKAEERKIRTHRLIEIGGAVESVLGRPQAREIWSGELLASPLPFCGKGALIDRRSLSISASRTVRSARPVRTPPAPKTAKGRRSCRRRYISDNNGSKP